MPIISFFGPDGSGKSTLAGDLLKVFLSRGINARVRWMRGTHTLASLLARPFLVKHIHSDGSTNPYQNIRIPPRMKRVWQLLEFASALPVVLFRFIFPSFMGLYVVAERYVPDFIVWVSVITNDYNYVENFEARFFLALAFRTCANVYVTADLEELTKRRKIDRESMSVQLDLYDVIASALNAHTLDTTARSADESLEEVLTVLKTQGVW